MKPEPRPTAMLAALMLLAVSNAPLRATAARVYLFPPTSSEAESPPVVRFELPKYTIPAIERETIAACLVLEAASQGDFGLRSVMAVVRNRAGARPELFAHTVLRPKQFSALNKLTAGRESLASVIARAKRDRMWSTALGIVDDATHEAWHDPTGGATHYTRTGERTPWTRSLALTTRIGAHSFYR